MIQDIYPHKLDNQYSNACPAKDGDEVFYFYKGELLLREDDSFGLPKKENFQKKISRMIKNYNICFILTKSHIIWRLQKKKSN